MNQTDRAVDRAHNLVPRAHVPFGQHQDTELWNNQFPETKILGLPASRLMRGLVYMASRDKVDVDMFHKGIQYALERLGKSKFGFESTTASYFKSKSHEGSGNELVDYSRAPCLGADQKARGLWERDCKLFGSQHRKLTLGFEMERRNTKQVAPKRKIEDRKLDNPSSQQVLVAM